MNKNLFKIGTILWERGQKFFFLFLLPQNFLRRTNVAMEDNGWGLTKFCLLPNFKNMRKPKGKILFKPLLPVSIFFNNFFVEGRKKFNFYFLK